MAKLVNSSSQNEWVPSQDSYAGLFSFLAESHNFRLELRWGQEVGRVREKPLPTSRWATEAMINEDNEYRWLTYDLVVKKLEGYLGNQSLAYPRATGFKFQALYCLQVDPYWIFKAIVA